MWVEKKSKKEDQMSNGRRILFITLNLISFFILPWLRYNIQKTWKGTSPSAYKIFNLEAILESFLTTKNLTVRIYQGAFLLYSIYLML